MNHLLNVVAHAWLWLYLRCCISDVQMKVLTGSGLTPEAVSNSVSSLREQCGKQEADSVHRTVQESYANTAKGEGGVANISSDRLGYR